MTGVNGRRPRWWPASRLFEVLISLNRGRPDFRARNGPEAFLRETALPCYGAL